MAIEITKTTTHITDARERVPGWLRNAANFLAFQDVLTSPSQTIENLLIQLVDETDIDNSVGVQLDVIGVILDATRVIGEPDAIYRIRLHGRGGQLGLSGEPETVISAFLLMTGANTVILSELYPASFELSALVDNDPQNSDLDSAQINAMNAVSGGGIGVSLLIVEENAFIYGNSSDADAIGDLPDDADHGWGDAADADAIGDITPGPGQGGNLARVLT